jgi:hypothetical protein
VTIAKGPRGATHIHRVSVPPELRRALAAIITERGCNRAVALLGVTHTTLYDATSPGGLITTGTLERLVDAVARVAKGAA